MTMFASEMKFSVSVIPPFFQLESPFIIVNPVLNRLNMTYKYWTPCLRIASQLGSRRIDGHGAIDAWSKTKFSKVGDVTNGFQSLRKMLKVC